MSVVEEETRMSGGGKKFERVWWRERENVSECGGGRKKMLLQSECGGGREKMLLSKCGGGSNVGRPDLGTMFMRDCWEGRNVHVNVLTRLSAMVIATVNDVCNE